MSRRDRDTLANSGVKILLITNLYEPYARGGAEQVVKTVAEGLVRRGHDVVILTAGPLRYGFLPREERGVFTFATAVAKVKTGKLRVLRFSPWNFYFVGNDWRFPKFIRALARLWEMVSPHPGLVLRRVLKYEKPDVVMTHNLVGLGMRIPAVIKKSGIRHIHTLHDVQLIHPSGLLLYGKEKQAEQSFGRKWYEHTMRRLWGSPDVVVAPSKWLLNLHISRGFFPASKITVLPNPISCPSFSRFHGLDHGSSQIRLLYAGQLEPHKGVRWLHSFLSSRTRNDELKVRSEGSRKFILEVAGSGSLEHEIKKAAVSDPQHIIFHSKLDQKALSERLAAVHALVVPSLCYENAPRIISEALCAGLPVVASRIGGIPEMLRDGMDGFLFEPGNAADFQHALSMLSSRPKWRDPSGLMTTDTHLDKLLDLV